jgi:hypothetical protein
VTTLAGSDQGFQDGIGSDAKIHHPFGMCLHPLYNCLYVSDWFNNKIRKVIMNGSKAFFILSQNIHTKQEK